MAGAVVFEENGLPIELIGRRDLERAIASGRLRQDMFVTTGFEQGAPARRRAGEIDFLQPFFGVAPPPEASEPARGAATADPDESPAATVDIARVRERPAGAETPRPWGRKTGETRLSVGPNPFAGWTGTAPAPPVPAAHDNLLIRAAQPLIRFADFKGRSSRREYWSFVLVELLAFLVLVALVAGSATGAGFIGIAILLLIVPNLSAAVRRLHDQEKSGLLLLLGLIPYVGWLIVAVLLSIPGTSGQNRYGPPPPA